MVDLSIDSDEEDKYAKVALAVSARLEVLYRNAPEDAELQDFSEETMSWDEKELIAEGEAIQKNGTQNVEGDDEEVREVPFPGHNYSHR